MLLPYRQESRCKSEPLCETEKASSEKRHSFRNTPFGAISGRERRLKQDANHVVSKRIVKEHPASMIGLENLTDIRERTKRKKGKKASLKQRKANATYSKWSFAELHSMIAYKALLNGSMAIKVDAHYTSKPCPMSGYTCDANYPNNAFLFLCQNFHYTLHH